MNREQTALIVRFRVVEGPHAGREFLFDKHDSFLAGRSSLAHFRLAQQDRYFSRAHFMVEVNPPRCRILDMGSRNGTYVNDERITQAELVNGDRIKAGKTVIEVLIDDDENQPEDSIAETTRTWHQPLETPLPAQPPAPADSLATTNSLTLPHIPGYRLGRILGEGGMGIVYLAHREDDGMPVAVKMIRPTADCSEREVRRFLREASILQTLRHPRIVESQQLGRAEGHLFFVMDFIPGIDAQQLVRSDGPLPAAIAVRLACQTLEALHYAHKQGIVHRDVKPSNLLIANREDTPSCMLADFGLARVYQASRLSGFTLVGEIAGTIPFMPPEQITDFQRTGPACDQYSLAATLFFLLTAKHVFDFADVPSEKRLSMILFDPPRPIQQYLPDLPDALAAAIHQGLEKDSKNRFNNADEFRVALEPFAD